VSGRPLHRDRLRRKVRAPIAGVLLLAGLSLPAGLLLSGCAGELPVPGQTSSTAAIATTATTETQANQLGRQVAATWSEAIQKLIPLLEGTPPIASLQAPVGSLKEDYVQKMVALGRQIAALDQSQRQAAYDRTTDVLDGTANSDWFNSYVRLYDQYAAGTDQTSQNFAVLLSTFNTLTQYAFFDLLKAQDPEEARRLGIQ
jgi:hypothetical protein